jgi:excisionase family DNA binding protein
MRVNEEMSGGDPTPETGEDVVYDMKSVGEAAELLRISESTVWRYADQGLLPSYRVGKKRVLFRRSDVEALLNRVRRKKEPMNAEARLRLVSMSEGAGAALDAMERAREVRARILARRGGVPVSDSWRDINEAREERTADL